METGARVCAIERGSTLDGTGIRYVIFVTSCPFRCKFCHNPESWASPDSFPFMKVGELVKNITRFSSFFKNGGVTVSGGEPLLHKKFLLEIFTELKKRNIHTAIDTCGHSNIDKVLEQIVELSDLFLVDIKHIDEEEHIKLTGKSKEKTLDFLKYINSKSKEIIIRVVMYCEQVNSTKYAKELALYLEDFKHNIKYIELLPYHSMGFDKWKKLNLDYDESIFHTPTKAQVQNFAKTLNEFGYNTKY